MLERRMIIGNSCNCGEGKRGGLGPNCPLMFSVGGIFGLVGWFCWCEWRLCDESEFSELEGTYKDHRVQLRIRESQNTLLSPLSEWPIRGTNPFLWCYQHPALTNWAPIQSHYRHIIPKHVKGRNKVLYYSNKLSLCFCTAGNPGVP